MSYCVIDKRKENYAIYILYNVVRSTQYLFCKINATDNTRYGQKYFERYSQGRKTDILLLFVHGLVQSRETSSKFKSRSNFICRAFEFRLTRMILQAKRIKGLLKLFYPSLPLYPCPIGWSVFCQDLFSRRQIF